VDFFVTFTPVFLHFLHLFPLFRTVLIVSYYYELRSQLHICHSEAWVYCTEVWIMKELLVLKLLEGGVSYGLRCDGHCQ